jgi:hypothetical protein
VRSERLVRVRAFVCTEAGLALAGLVAITTALWLPARISSWSREHALIDDLPTGAVPAAYLLGTWSNLRGTVTLLDPLAADTRIRFVSRDVPLDWELTQRILEAHDVALDTKNLNGHELVVAHLRRSLCCHHAPVEATEVAPGPLVTAVLAMKRGTGPDVYANLRGMKVGG